MRKAGQDLRVVRCVLPHTQRCHESKACTSPATALYFSQNKQPQRQQAARASVEQVGTGGEGREGGRAVIHILPPLSCPRPSRDPACAPPVCAQTTAGGRDIAAAADKGQPTSHVMPAPATTSNAMPHMRRLKLMTTVTQDNDAHDDSENGRQAVHSRYWLLVCGAV